MCQCNGRFQLKGYDMLAPCGSKVTILQSSVEKLQFSENVPGCDVTPSGHRKGKISV